jgi:hypothetical protein
MYLYYLCIYLFIFIYLDDHQDVRDNAIRVHLCIYSFIYLFIYLCIYLYYLFIYIIYLFIHLFIYLFNLFISTQVRSGNRRSRIHHPCVVHVQQVRIWCIWCGVLNPYCELNPYCILILCIKPSQLRLCYSNPLYPTYPHTHLPIYPHTHPLFMSNREVTNTTSGSAREVRRSYMVYMVYCMLLY